MNSLSKILLPVDFSERSMGAAHYARLLAGRFQSELTVLHVLMPEPPANGDLDMGGTMLGQVYQNRSAQASREIESFAATELAGLNVRSVVAVGDPAATIVESAREQGAGLIIMPTHGYGPFRHFLLGSNTAKVLHDAACPVWTGVHIDPAPEAASMTLGHILCAVDLGGQSLPTLCWAAQLARGFGARISVVHSTATAPEPDDAMEADWQSRMRQDAEGELRRLREHVRADGAMLIESGDPAKVICAAAERIAADLLVIGRGSAAGVFGRLRTNASAIIRMSPCPVVSV